MMKKYAMGIDIGGTNTAFGLVDEDGNVIAESKISTEKYRYFDDYKPYIDTLAAAMKELIASQPECDLIGIGVGAPNANIHSGRIETPANLWKFEDPSDPRPNSIRTFNFVEDLGKHFGGVKVMITNDANAAAWGEAIAGAAKGTVSSVMITLGTGVGGGTLLGLSKKMLNIRDFDSIVQTAKGGNLANVDLFVNDLTTTEIPTLPAGTTASNFGRADDLASKSDIAMGIVNMVFQTIGVIAVLSAQCIW